MMIYSFNDSKLGTIWTGFTLDWYPKLFSNEQIMSALKNSLYVAVITTLISTVLGTLAALSLHRYTFPGKRIIDLLIYIPVMIPSLVLGIGLLTLYAWLGVSLQLETVIPGHVVIATSFVTLVVMARLKGFDSSLEEAAKDLGANGWHTFWKVTFPLISPGVLAGALMGFTISMDEFVIAFFTTGPGANTLPVLIFSMVRQGVTPEINVLSTILILIITALVFIVGLRNTRKETSNG